MHESTGSRGIDNHGEQRISMRIDFREEIRPTKIGFCNGVPSRQVKTCLTTIDPLCVVDKEKTRLTNSANPIKAQMATHHNLSLS